MTGQYSNSPWERVIWAIDAGLDPDPLDIEDGLASGQAAPSTYLQWRKTQDAWGLVSHSLDMNRSPHPDDLELAKMSGIEPPDDIARRLDDQIGSSGRGRRLTWREHDEVSYAKNLAACRLVDRMRSESSIGRRLTKRSVMGVEPAFQWIEPLSYDEIGAANQEPVEDLLARLTKPDHGDRMAKAGSGLPKRNFYRTWWRPSEGFIADVRGRVKSLLDQGLDKRKAFRIIALEGVYAERATQKQHLPVGLLWQIYSKGKGLASNHFN